MRKGWHDLKCTCGSGEFIEVLGIKWHPGQGTSNNHRRLECKVCGTAANAGQMVREKELELAKRELDLKIAEIENLNPEPPKKVQSKMVSTTDT